MKYLIYLLIFSFFSCQPKSNEESKDFNAKLVDFVIDNPNGNYVEIDNLNVSLPLTILEDDQEKLILAQILKNKGFKVTDSGRGNHPFGPRIVSLTLKKGGCECEVDKIYYSTALYPESIYSVTERVKCYQVGKH